MIKVTNTGLNTYGLATLGSLYLVISLFYFFTLTEHPMSDHPFSALTPDFVINAVESIGLWCDARIYPLNSYENRVYQVGIEDSTPLVAKFYRPNRWTKEQILEEHDALFALAQADINVIAPKQIEGESLFLYGDFFFCVYDKLIGKAPDADNMDHLFVTGETLAQIHQGLQAAEFKTRPSMAPVADFTKAIEQLKVCQHLPKFLRERLDKINAKLLPLIQTQVDKYWPTKQYPIHGDCHRSNLLVDGSDDIYLLDFDDAKTGPAVQDLWLHLSGNLTQQKQQLSELIEGYESYFEFNEKELELIDSLKAIRLVQYAAWLDARWDDPAFPMAFPWFSGEDYWLNLLNDLELIIQDWGKLAAPAY
ncbi:serine/threonine protein kinase [Marinomonas sp. PE14-40]|uniref:serine/threonine protein kinase n=1 Tax=Marinomonas sp. PE14-40 TaxID=3060621 RepID=UPI003F68056A